jgi:hypothetical protein
MNAFTAAGPSVLLLYREALGKSAFGSMTALPMRTFFANIALSVSSCSIHELRDGQRYRDFALNPIELGLLRLYDRVANGCFELKTAIVWGRGLRLDGAAAKQRAKFPFVGPDSS